MATLVFVHAHPDDEAIATGGTMARAAAEGHTVVLVVATHGELGEPVPGVLKPGEELWERRVAETHRSADILGVSEVHFLGYRDSGMVGEPTNDDPRCFWQADVDEAANRLAAILTAVDADVVTIYDDHGGYGHPDHIQVHRVGLEAARRAGVANVFEATMNRTHIARLMAEQEAVVAADPEAADDAAGTGAPEPDLGSPEELITHAVDVGDYLGAKRSAMFAHASQIGPDSMFAALPPPSFAEAFGTEWYIRTGATRAPGAPFGTHLVAEQPVQSG